MAIIPVSSNINTAAAIQGRGQVARAKEVENNKDDKASAAAQAAPRPTVNTIGQMVGSIVNTQA